MTIPRLFLLLPVVLATALPIEADALVMCAKVRRSTGEIREGTPIRLRAVCKTNETEVDPVALGLEGPPGQPGSPGIDGSDGLNGLDGADGLSCWDANANFACDVAEDVADPFGCGIEDCAAQVVDMSTCEVVFPSFSQNGHDACGTRVCVAVHVWASNAFGTVINQLGSCSSQNNVTSALCCG